MYAWSRLPRCRRLYRSKALYRMCIMTVHRLDQIRDLALALRVLALLHLCDLGVRGWYGLVSFQLMWTQAHLN